MFGCTQKHPDTKPPILKVDVAKVQVASMEKKIHTFGSVMALKSISIQSQVDGQLLKRFFKDGQMVKKGDLLFVIDPSLYKSSLDLAYANLEKSKANYQLALITYERNKQLAANEYISELDFEEFESNLKSAKAQIKADEANLKTARTNYSYCFIKAPITGHLSEHKVDAGSLVQKQNTVLTTLNQMDPIFVEFSLSDTDFETLPKKQTFICEIETQLGFIKRSAVSFIDNHIDVQTATILLKCQLDNQGLDLWPGQFVNVKMITDTYPNALIIPKKALFFANGGRYVYLFKNNRAQKVEVEILVEEQERVAIQKGISECDEVIISGLVKLHDGLKVSKVSENE
jgi:multidrug efflux system membrane fusion protein